ncbi:MAG: DUF2798 domain-containing protein [Acinetobacter sp.]|nr:DUF2798 domain-containing protein [Acinetobacter sp.]
MSKIKFHPKHMTWLMPLILSGIMSGAISCYNMILNLGLVHNFLELWLFAWAKSWLLAFPLILVVLPIVRNTLLKFVDSPK